MRRIEMTPPVFAEEADSGVEAGSGVAICHGQCRRGSIFSDGALIAVNR